MSFVRTVIDKELGGIFQKPGTIPWKDYGAFVGSPAPHSMDADGIIVVYGKIDKFAPSQDTTIRGFPYTKLKQLEALEVAAGRPPIYVTATYQGKSRPVYWSWSLGLPVGSPHAKPTTTADKWEQAVNVADQRFVDFWLNKYAKPTLAGITAWKTNWLEGDEGAYDYNLFGVIDDAGFFVPGVAWDSPFPNNPTSYIASVASFFSQIAGSGINIMPDIGSLGIPSVYATVFADVPGGMVEDLYSPHNLPTIYTRNSWWNQGFQLIPWMGTKGKVVIARAVVPAGNRQALLTAFATYCIMKGPNFFFAPGDPAANTINPSQWKPWADALGKPLYPYTSTVSGSGVQPGFRIFQRIFEGGRVFLNWSGKTQTVPLDNRYTHYDIDGNVVTTLTIGDMEGAFARFELNNLPMVRISPRVAAGTQPTPGTVTLECDNAAAAMNFTLDGTDPKVTSPLYVGPITLGAATRVTARAFLKGFSPSYAAVADYI